MKSDCKVFRVINDDLLATRIEVMKFLDTLRPEQVISVHCVRLYRFSVAFWEVWYWV
jgi:hypothetical protein